MEYKPGDRIELKKNPNYYYPGIPKLDEIEFRIMPETAARVAAIDTGAIDLIWDLPPEVIDQLKKESQNRADSVPTSTWDGLIMNARKSPTTMYEYVGPFRLLSTRKRSWSSPYSATARQRIE